MSNLRLKHCIIIWALVGMGFIAPIAQRIQSRDLWWHITTGKLIMETGSVSHQDPYSFTAAGEPWIAHEWLSDIIFYGTYQSLGLRGIILLRSLLILGMCFGLYVLINQRIKWSLVSALTASVLTISTCAFWIDRPQLFSYVLLVGPLLLIDRYRRGGSLWPAVPIFALWINMHGAWIAGFGIFTIILVEEAIHSLQLRKTGRITHLVLVWIASFGALFINAFGLKLLLYPFQYIGPTFHTTYISEWKRPALAMHELWPYFIILVGLPVLVLLGRAKVRLSEWLFIFATGLASVASVRHVPVFLIMASPIIASQLKVIVDRHPERQSSSKECVPLNWVLLALLVVFLLIRFPVHSKREDYIIKSILPIHAADYLSSHDIYGQGKLMSRYNWGGYLIFRLYPDYKVSIDGRADVYGEDRMEREERLEHLKGNWQADLKQMAPDVILWGADKPLSDKLGRMPGWRRVYRDEMSVIYVRK